MQYIDADRLRAEIERRKRKNMDVDIQRSMGRYLEDRDLLALLDSLQQEQESVAERFARIVRGNLIGIDKEVQQKFEQLYFEVTGNKMYGGYND